MALSTDEIFDAALELPIENRRELAARLLETLEEGDRAEIERAWLDVARRRLENYRAGRSSGRPADEVFESLRAQTTR